MQVVESGDFTATCVADGQVAQVDLMLVGRQEPGTWLLVFLNAAREVLSEDDAMKIRDALRALHAVLQGEETDIDIHFADLAERQPQLPHFLAASPEKQ